MRNKDKPKPEIEPPKRAKRAIKKLHKLVDFLEYFCGRNKFFRDTIVKELAQDIEDVLHELSIEKNIDHIRLATKLKTIWNKQLDNTIEERVEEEVEQRLDDMIEEIKKDK
ncbi:hypothetical protein KAR91_24240 [Candidatus Pacearchaeota archaeon]|nr:hypothetical protein [Candidatus Pacearchaeota archaeon]